jgi:phage anti-repressor protein/arsenate reductase-like glutaredoxin family protein
MTIANMKATPINYMGQQMFTTTQVATRLNIEPTMLHNCRKRKYLNENLHWYSLDEHAVIQLKEDNVDNNALGKITNKVVLWTLEGINKVIEVKRINIDEDDNTIPVELVIVDHNDNELMEDKTMCIENVEDIGVDGDKVDSRKLYAFLQVNERYNDWFSRMCEYGFVEGVDFYCKNSKSGNTMGRPAMNHELTISMAKEISMLQRNERGKQARLYFIRCEERSKQKPMTQSEIIAAMANQNVEMERRMALTEAKQEQQAKEIQGIRETITIKPDDDWRSNTTKLINKIVEAMGGGANTHMEVRRQIYNALNDRFGVCVDTRLRNKRDRMREVGCSKSQIDKTNILDVIAEDKKLIEGYVAIVKDMAIKYGV